MRAIATMTYPGAGAGLGIAARGLVARMVEAGRRARQRAELAGLPDYRLKDLGITRGQALSEARKPFWLR